MPEARGVVVALEDVGLEQGVFRDPGKGVQPKTEIPQLPWVHAMWQQARNFVDAVAGKRPTMCTAGDALEDIRLAREYIRMMKGQ